jgi:transposase
MYIKNSNLTKRKLGQLITEWIYNTPARVCAKKIHLHRNTANWWYNRIRHLISTLPEPQPFSGIVEIDESYFGKKRPWVKGVGTADKVAIFGARERQTGKVWSTVVEGTDHAHLIPIIENRIAKGSTICSDGFGAYYRLNKLGYKHYKVLHEYSFVDLHIVHTNGIESYWSYVKQLFYSRRGMPRRLYQLHLKEAEFRFNNRDPRKLRLLLRKMLKNDH